MRPGWFSAVLLCSSLCCAQTTKSYSGFDRNSYPGDDLLPRLHSAFSFTGYWLSNPPGETSNSWRGKRTPVKASGLGFLLLFNGRLAAQLAGKDAAALGMRDAQTAIASAAQEGFSSGSIIFLDQEEGGRLSADQAAYLFSWLKGVGASKFRAGVYCSGIPVAEGSSKITTASQILEHEKGKPPALWVVNDAGPPSPGCVLPKRPISPGQSGIEQAMVWQFTRSPRTEFAGASGPTYAADGNCYVPGLAHSPQTFVDLDVATSPDPSGGRR